MSARASRSPTAVSLHTDENEISASWSLVNGSIELR